jgi:predicted nucleic acid-binding protein
MRADLVIVDERLARLYAKRLRLTLTGTLGVIIKAKERGLIVAVKPLIDELRRNGIRIGPRLTAEALRQSGES